MSKKNVLVLTLIKKIKNSYINFRKSQFISKEIYQGNKRAVYNDKELNYPRRHKNS